MKEGANPGMAIPGTTLLSLLFDYARLCLLLTLIFVFSPLPALTLVVLFFLANVLEIARLRCINAKFAEVSVRLTEFGWEGEVWIVLLSLWLKKGKRQKRGSLGPRQRSRRPTVDNTGLCFRPPPCLRPPHCLATLHNLYSRGRYLLLFNNAFRLSSLAPPPTVVGIVSTISCCFLLPAFTSHFVQCR